jgi:hypothetical protein
MIILSKPLPSEILPLQNLISIMGLSIHWKKCLIFIMKEEEKDWIKNEKSDSCSG